MNSAPPVKRNSSFRNDVIRLISGTSAAAFITILVTPALTRLYTPQAFGIAALFAAVTAIIGVLACMRYEFSIVLPEDDREAANLLALSLAFSVLTSITAIPLIWFGGPQVLTWAGIPDLIPYLWLLPLMILVHGFFLALNYWNTRTKHFTRLGIARVTGASTTAAGGLVPALVGSPTGSALIAAQLGGQAVATAVLGSLIWRDNGRFILGSLSWKEIWEGAKLHRGFPMYSTWTALFNNASLQFAPLLLASLYGAAIAGMFALTLRVLSIPASLVGGAVGNVFYSRAPQAHQEGNLHTLVETIHGKLATVAIPVLVVLLNFGPELFRFVFGEQWYKAGQYAQWMAPWLYFQFQWSPLSTIAPVLGLQREALISQTLTFIARIISLLCCAWLGTTADAAVLTFAVVSAIVYLLRQLWFLQRAGVATLKVMKRDALSILFLSLLVLPAHLALEVDSPSAQYFSIIYIVLLSLFWLRSLR